MAVSFFDELIPMRISSTSPDESEPPVLRTLDRDTGYIADPKSHAIVPASQAPQATYPTSWLPTEALARAWQRLVGG